MFKNLQTVERLHLDINRLWTENRFLQDCLYSQHPVPTSYQRVETLEQATQTLDVPVNMLEQYRTENEALR
ncbi:hypothetical protein P879_03731 [Paragonimus westermani]|uniref:Uncharacterized protein n=1 Tax=Paragonimus westermani TaxID=34504 RepID=A0A8T0DSW3_9TREM|nr:hypothetical protein P879_03731 [Paragonimus westermani]